MGLFLSGTSCSDAHVGIDDTVSLAHLDAVAALGASPVPAAGPAGCWHCAAAAIALRLGGLKPGLSSTLSEDRYT